MLCFYWGEGCCYVSSASWVQHITNNTIYKILMCLPCFKCQFWRHPDRLAVNRSMLMFTFCSNQYLFITLANSGVTLHNPAHLPWKAPYRVIFLKDTQPLGERAELHWQRRAVAETGSHCQLVNNSQELSNTIKPDWEGCLSGRLAGWQTACGGGELNNSLFESLAVRWVNKLQRGESNPQPSWPDKDSIKGF